MGMAGSLDGIRRIIADNIGLAPVHFFSHGSTMMLGEQSQSADYWRRTGEEALAHNIKGVIIMVSHIGLQILTTN
jgi:aromatic ring-opening dioxygenase catalytic subunit (LigB family)